MGLITGRGINQGDLYAYLVLLRTNFLGVCAKLDLDGGVADTNYQSSLTFAFPTSIGPTGISHQGAIQDYLSTLQVKMNALFAKLDLDATVNSNDYAGQFNVPARIDINSANRALYRDGVYEGSLVRVLKEFADNWNLALAHLDSDSGVTGTNYTSLWGITIASTFDTTGLFFKVN